MELKLCSAMLALLALLKLYRYSSLDVTRGAIITTNTAFIHHKCMHSLHERLDEAELASTVQSQSRAQSILVLWGSP